MFFFELEIKNILRLQDACLRSWKEMTLMDLPDASRVTKENRTLRTQGFANNQCSFTIDIIQNLMAGQVWLLMPVIPGRWEAEAGGLLVARSSGPAWAP